ncbi:MAG: V-type ATPase 116kDa subunit family protein, partial [Paludibacter sp.]|nr:V-type ATPase 116kDa subunit family protein [Paludibacter sp.]
DLLSYIRLFALGISSSVMGFVFNDLAMKMSGDIPVLNIIIMLVILLIGHGINIFMACLGGFVHPMRLTFVEFYKNAGFEGGGKKYKPFKQVEKQL